ncbi:12571_t:CDS:2, partial [Funneliformis mosseae]
CDLWSLAGVIAVEVLGGPKIPWKFGRKDAKDGINREQHIPGISSGPDGIHTDFGPLGLTERDIVALIGAHTVGRSHQKFENGEGKWTEQNNRFTNQFYVNLEKTSNKLASVNLASKNSFSQGSPDMIMLASDLALFRDPKFKEIAKEYARNQKKKLYYRLNQSDGSSSSQLKGQNNILYTQGSFEPSLSTAQLTFSANDPGNLSFSVIELLLLLRSTQTAMIYPGSIEGTNEQPNLGNFIIKRVAEVEKSLTGDWHGVERFEINGHILVDGLVIFDKKYPRYSVNHRGRRIGSEIWGEWNIIGTPDRGVFLIWSLSMSTPQTDPNSVY